MKPTRPTLMVVDDEPEVLHSVHALFRRDYQVQTFERAPEALKALEHVDVPVVMSDQRMPEMTGVEFLGHVKRIRPDTTRLLFTGYADIKAVIDAINEGNVFRYITKPWDADDLAAVVRQAVDQHHLIVERRRLIAELHRSNAQLVEANRLKEAFIEVASHELNTPVAVVLGMSDLWRLMRADDATAPEAAWLDRIQNAGKRLAGTLERMLKLLRAGRFDATLDARPTELLPLLHRVVADLHPFVEARGQNVEVRVAHDLGSAEVDAAKVGDVLTNLIVNAIKFTPDEGTIEVQAGPEAADRVWFQVKDSGVGVPQADRAHLFEPFFTGLDTMHHSSGEYQFCKRGIGLGLCLVKSFVELHGGSVAFQSEPGRGTTFRVVLPRRRPSQSGAGVSSALVQPVPRSMDGPDMSVRAPG